ncbi:Major Facilitator Superfamily protein [Arthrobacter ulcerisalmonis]|uniref:Major Facilitator Superfamily protein n=1 Tax=Arthrobacter ulcerisalmonis TaxID=2483813 RepID=A0A3P5XP59_9MICC|nr:MFS transporter [Arthrobacter ulcerisalmonis]VDC32173.1 Major Facilitator Superfamily protein [Arthrobacter ulcerisalmonis]
MYISISDRNGGQETSLDHAPATPFKLSPVILWLGVVSMATDISSESVSAILPLYITGFLGLSVIAFGVIDGVNQGASAVVRIAAGWASDQAGRPKAIAMAGYGLSMLARVGFLFAGGFWSVAAVVTGDRIGKGIRTAPRDALITTAAQPEHLARHFGVHRLLDNIGAAAGPLIAFVILMVMPNGYGTVFVVSLAFAAIGVAALALVVPDLRTGRPVRRRLRSRTAVESSAVEPSLDAPAGTTAGVGQPAPSTSGPAAHRASGRKFPRIRWSLFREPGLGRLLWAAAILGILTVGDGFIYLVLQDKDQFAVQWFPLLYVGTNVVFLLLAVPMGRLADKWGKGRVFLAGHVALLACYLLAAAPSFGLVGTLGCLILLGAFYAATDGVLAAFASQLSPANQLATGIGAAQTVVAVSRVISSTVFGVLWFTVGSSLAMIIVGCLLAVAVPASYLILRPARHQGATV